MPFKEKIAWISVVTTIVAWGGYFGFMMATRARLPTPVYTLAFVGAVVMQIALVVVATIVTALLAPRDAGAGNDERDRDIARRSGAVAYPVLLTLVVGVAASMHFGMTSRDMAYGIMAAIVVAEVVHYGAQIVGYRSGRHG